MIRDKFLGMKMKNPRINITVEESTVELLSQIAQYEHKSISSLTKDLVMEALDRREDRILSAISEIRDTSHAKTVKHTDVW